MIDGPASVQMPRSRTEGDGTTIVLDLTPIEAVGSWWSGLEGGGGSALFELCLVSVEEKSA